MKSNIDLFNFGRAWHLSWSRVVDDDDFDVQTGWWLSGRLAGRLVSYFLRWRKRWR